MPLYTYTSFLQLFLVLTPLPWLISQFLQGSLQYYQSHLFLLWMVFLALSIISLLPHSIYSDLVSLASQSHFLICSLTYSTIAKDYQQDTLLSIYQSPYSSQPHYTQPHLALYQTTAPPGSSVWPRPPACPPHWPRYEWRIPFGSGNLRLSVRSRRSECPVGSTWLPWKAVRSPSTGCRCRTAWKEARPRGAGNHTLWS